MWTAGQEIVPNAQCADYRLDDSRSAERMSRKTLGRTARGRGTKQVEHGAIFGGVSNQSRRAVEIDVVDFGRLEAGGGKRPFHRQTRAEAIRMRRRHMIGIRTFADAAGKDGIRVDPAGWTVPPAEAGGLAEREATAFGIERPARLVGHHAERLKAVQRGRTQRVGAADDRGIA